MKYLILLLLAALLVGACAETDNRYRGRDSMINLANTCATCGATVSEGYFFNSNWSATGPGHQ